MNTKANEALSEMYSLLENLRNQPELKIIGPTVGLNAALLTHGDTLYASLQLADEEQARTQIEHKTTTANLSAKRRSTHQAYMVTMQIADLRVTNTNARRLLQIDGERKRTVNERLEELRHFYGLALGHAECRAALLEATITLAELEAGRDAILAIDSLISKRATLNTNRKAATKQVRLALRQARSWMRGTRALMAPEVDDKPHLKEALGITIHKEKTVREADAEYEVKDSATPA